MAYNKLSTANLPDPVIDPAQGSSPEDYFNTVLYTGDGTTANAITGVGFQPDWLWIKQRDTARGHQLVDAVRGVSLNLRSDATNAESASGVNSFDADGFEVDITGTNGTNASGGTYVAWNWKANGSGVSNTNGSITSTVSANTTSGFSIVSYTGNSTDGATIGHGLDSEPEMVIVKIRNQAYRWMVYFSGVTSDLQTLILNDTAAVSSLVNPAWSTVDTDTSVFGLGNNGDVNGTSDNYIAYCFHSVEGFSKFGSYTGNGSTDGPFVYTGFRPSMIMVKASSTTSHWYILDAVRNTYNEVDSFIKPNSSNADATSLPFDFTSNGFKIRTSSGGPNTSGATYIYMAFAENPFKYSNAR